MSTHESGPVKRPFELAGEPIYTITEAAALLGVHYETVREWVKTGRIQSLLVGRRRRVRKSALELFCGIVQQNRGPESTPTKQSQSNARAVSPESVLAAIRAKHRL